jgi:hypothetical protein
MEHMWNVCSEMRERERKERREILNENGREIREIWKRRERIEEERGGDRKKMLNFVIVIFVFVIRNPKACRANK